MSGTQVEPGAPGVDGALAAGEQPVELLRRLIRFDTTNPPGNEKECIGYIEGLLAGAGLETTLRARDPERPSLVARLGGAGNAPPLLLYGHVDVVSTDGQRWQHPPFEARVEDGFVWGRGALDMKSGVAMLLSAVLRAAASGMRPAGDILFCALSDEEGWGDFGAKWIVEEHPELFEGVRYALGEFGGFTLHIGGRRFYPIQVAEKQVCTVRATVRGAGGHGAMPIRGGTTARLAAVLRALDGARLPIHMTPVVRDMARAIAAATSPPASVVMNALTRPTLTGAALRAMGQRGRSLDPQLRNTASATILRAGEKVNVIPATGSVILDGRLLPGFTPDDMLTELRAVLPRDVELEVTRHDPGPADPDMALFDALGSVLRDLDADGVPIPLMMAGVTDARFFSRLGIQTYGFLPMKLPAGFDFWQTIHGADERIPVEAVEFGAEAVYRALARYGEAA